jgi:hypothetical protein
MALVQKRTRAPEVIVGDLAVNNKRTDGLSGTVLAIDGRTGFKAQLREKPRLRN